MNITKEANIAAKWILDKKVIAYPTEGVWGIGGLNIPEIINAISLAKNRGEEKKYICLLYTSPSPRDGSISRMPSSA